MTASSQRLESLDSIRGLAALAVLFGHTLGAFNWPAAYVNWSQWPFLNMAVNGHSAVTMFFVLSGFVLVRPFLTTSRRLLVPAFYLRRITRVWLPWFFVFMASLMARRWLMHSYQTQPPLSDWLLGFWRQPLLWGEMLKQCVFGLHDFSRVMLPQDWSLGVELRGSALIPIFLIMARRRRGWLWLGITALAFFIFRPTGGYYVAFIVGVLLAKYCDEVVGALKRRTFGWRLTVLLVGIVGYEARWAAEYSHWGRFLTDQAVWVIGSFGCALIILATLSSRRLSHFLVRRPVLFVGQISYSVYLWQFIILICVLPAWCHWLNGLGMNMPGLFTLNLLACLGLTLVLSWGSYQAIEKPSIELGHWWSKKLGNTGQRAAV